MSNDLVRGVGLGLLLAVVLNVLLYAGGRALGVAFMAAQPGATGFERVELIWVVAASILAALAGGVVAWLLGNERARGLTTFGWLALVVGLLSLLVPYRLAQDSGSFVLLGLMHVAAALAIVYGLAHFYWRCEVCVG